MRKPDFFIVGAPKCGTTAMNDYLQAHPEIFIPAKKEIHFFGADLQFQRPRVTLPEYLSYFAPVQREKRVGEASVWYLYSQQAAAEIKSFSPAARILIMLRNPVDMMYSLHSQRLYNDNENLVNFEEALAAEADRRQGKRLYQNALNTMGFFYRAAATYTPQVQRYFEVFGREQVHVIIFDDFTEATDEVYCQNPAAQHPLRVTVIAGPGVTAAVTSGVCTRGGTAKCVVKARFKPLVSDKTTCAAQTLMKIVHVISGLSTGGAEMMLYKLLSLLNRTAFETEVVSLVAVGPVGEQIQALQVPVWTLGMRRRVPNPVGLYRLVHRLRQDPPHLLQTWMYHADLIGGLAAKLAGGIPVVWNIRHGTFGAQGGNRSSRLAMKACGPLSRWLPTRIICCSEVSFSARPSGAPVRALRVGDSRRGTTRWVGGAL